MYKDGGLTNKEANGFPQFDI